MLIANPIYDVTFKRLLENDRTAKFFIGTILGCKVLSLVPTVQERTRIDEDTGKLTLFRMDFAATIETKEEGRKRVIIEMQKALHFGDIYRFKKYLGEEYKKSELPIISIYILGFNLSVESPAFVVRPDCRDLRTNEELKIRDGFVEQLTHRAYFIQTKRIKPGLNTKLEQLLSIFEQANFAEADSEKIKYYLLETDDPEIKEVLNVLHYIAEDKEAREKLDEEEYFQEAMEEMFGEKDRKMAKQAEALAQKDGALAQQAEALVKQAEALAQKDEEIERLKKLLGSK